MKMEDFVSENGCCSRCFVGFDLLVDDGFWYFIDAGHLVWITDGDCLQVVCRSVKSGLELKPASIWLRLGRGLLGDCRQLVRMAEQLAGV